MNRMKKVEIRQAQGLQIGDYIAVGPACFEDCPQSFQKVKSVEAYVATGDPSTRVIVETEYAPWVYDREQDVEVFEVVC